MLAHAYSLFWICILRTDYIFVEMTKYTCDIMDTGHFTSMLFHTFEVSVRPTVILYHLGTMRIQLYDSSKKHLLKGTRSELV